MRIERLRGTDLRCFREVEFVPGPGVSWLAGANGAGKTTLLEAAYLLAHGRSFRAGGRSAPGREGAAGFVIHAEVRWLGRPTIQLGLQRSEGQWSARRDGTALAALVPLFEVCPVVYFGPDSQALVTGPAEERRGFLDWAVFHVEHTSAELWRDWRRALRQRNALLRQGAADNLFEPWEHDLGRLAGRIHELRQRCIKSLESYLVAEAARLVPELGAAALDYRPGWDTEAGLAAQLVTARAQDRVRGFTRHGAHRADWSLAFAGVPQRDYLSRGQAKAIALACTLGLASWLKERVGEYPLLCLDDLAAELDPQHVGLVLDWLHGKSLQAWLTCTDDAFPKPSDASVFHVEHSGCTPIAAQP